MKRALFPSALLLALLVLAPALYAEEKAPPKEVVVYTSVDQNFSGPVLKDFEKATGIKVLPVFDVEAAKTAGLVNRLIAEKSRPRADVFWNGEASRTLVLKKEGALAPFKGAHFDAYPAHVKDPEGYWCGFAARARVLLVNTNLLKPEEYPKSILELTEPKWKGKVTIAYPLFGTTAMHVSALWTLLGPEKTKQYLKGLVANQALVVDGNSVTRDSVAEGKAAVGFTDTDDAGGAVAKGAPVKMLFPDQEGMGTLVIPNTAAMVAGAPHPEEAKAFLDYLMSPENERRLVADAWAQAPLHKDNQTGGKPGAVKSMEVPLDKVAEHMEPSAKFCQELFTR
jgi:iron(III) transport system substrate-binding protein